ncbi:Multidrug resistance protein MdtN [BD1-7 clade bacterium]|uniref:Multidrug resistance protein MdtN n=1 Tax=BD1-7 clade bacterium TaxID=2029982 RepID=A0A5S9QYP5_9GAMM|nr:Multidrug resistance protein MdtN [BD1-7 clade bacterium]
MGWLGKINKWIWITSTVVALILLYYSSGYFIVYNNDAYVHADIVRVSTGVPGIIDKVHVSDNQFVEAGDPILTLEQEPFIYAVAHAASALDKAQAEYALLDTQADEAAAQINIAESRNALAKLEFERYKNLLKDGVIAQNDFDERQEQYAITQATLVKAHKVLTNIEQQRPVYAADIKLWQSQLAEAEYDLALSRIVARNDGFINNLRVYPGDYANTGDALFGFVNTRTDYIIANIKESNLPLIHPGKHVWVYLSSQPWRLWQGKVASVGRAVSRSAVHSNAALPYVEPITSWIRYDYRIPVRIYLLDYPDDRPLYIGLDARVLVLP